MRQGSGLFYRVVADTNRRAREVFILGAGRPGDGRRVPLECLGGALCEAIKYPGPGSITKWYWLVVRSGPYVGCTCMLEEGDIQRLTPLQLLVLEQDIEL